MNVSEFVEAIRLTVECAAVDDCLEQYAAPSGRKPSADLIQLSDWYNSVSDRDRTMLKKAMTDAVHASLFGLFCVLDGVRQIENTQDRGELELWHVRDGERTLINDANENLLHDEYNAC